MGELGLVVRLVGLVVVTLCFTYDDISGQCVSSWEL